MTNPNHKVRERSVNLGSPVVASITPKWQGIFLDTAWHKNELTIVVDKGAMNTELSSCWCGADRAPLQSGTTFKCKVGVGSLPENSAGSKAIAAVYAINIKQLKSNVKRYLFSIDAGVVDTFVWFTKLIGTAFANPAVKTALAVFALMQKQAKNKFQMKITAAIGPIASTQLQRTPAYGYVCGPGLLESKTGGSPLQGPGRCGRDRFGPSI